MKKDNLKDKIKKNAYLIVGVLILLVLWIKSIFSMDDKIPHKSKDKIIDNAINTIDVCIDAFGTFNSDHLPIFEVLRKLSKEQIILFERDFGYRYYNPVLNYYLKVSVFRDYLFSKPYSFKGLIYKEFDDTEISIIKDIYKTKGLDFLLV
ncbi:hypothetical protein [Tenacibaculum finnmarkense]|uniref:hypothetical protein n=1 Tax=Tenacibaculum finnmarkense TaxID=2781243 RepID=UPI001E29480F|nr:hypothetical protein [Tenacibaculum finnmarkense]MCD8411768.1 hypothetical protein [Tenacibaculum finnmarkense genomovar ulcerans]MCG8740992.1 hypothetical protein [Tenacibaculum finnmarkense]MCG8764281.1 hypothetical protein [Tenacibaculum finnmarkense]MCG8777202.1 hypothetical protein [Tenacibaculum finnmarkense]MCM8905574.1 hypothetical protein [Tenacibaculum finnmarkense genomovar finnmarkense]